MTVFTDTWNATFEATPSDTELAQLGAGRIRSTRLGVRERMVVDHALAGNADDGKHKWATFLDRGSSSAATIDTDEGFLFVAIVAGKTELFYQNSANQVIQLTAAGVINLTTFAAGTKIVFAQAAAPTGWVIDATHNDRVLRVNSTVGAGTGGSWTISGVTTQGHTLTTSEIPTHAHQIELRTAGLGGPATAVGRAPDGAAETIGTTASAGSGASHDHGAVVSDAVWRPAYLDTIVCTKS